MSSQHHVNYNSVARSKSRERETDKKESENTQGRSKEKKEEKDRKDRKRVSISNHHCTYWNVAWGRPHTTQFLIPLRFHISWVNEMHITLVRMLHLLTEHMSCFVPQDHGVNDREASQESKRRKDENGTSKFVLNQLEEAIYPASTLQWSEPNEIFPSQIPPKTARARVLPATPHFQLKERRAKDPNLPVKRRLSLWNLSERPPEAKRSARLVTLH